MKTTAAKAAALIRKNLKENFPDIKFSVTCQNFSMGDSVNVSWKNGPTTYLIKDIIGKYQYGEFNGLNDSYEHTNVVEGLPQVMFIRVNRYLE
jgi:hypothetical protein